MNTSSQYINDLFFSQYGLVLGIARRYAPDADLASEIVHQAYVDFAQGIRKKNWDVSNGGGPLLATITRNAALRLWKARQREASEKQRLFDAFLREGCDEFFSDYEDSPWEEELSTMQKCLDRLPLKSRQMIDLRYFLNDSVEEIAKISNVGVRTVQRALQRIREELRRCIEKTISTDP